MFVYADAPGPYAVRVFATYACVGVLARGRATEVPRHDESAAQVAARAVVRQDLDAGGKEGAAWRRRRREGSLSKSAAQTG